ncbi:hypothetical protein [Chromobacterium sp. IIBBL 290-4]|uniref:hypothetical protein n=1 Tax=Chromobacterium sp. IIBBL 290-4 TaxID=2953890 RepID=UPI0020B7F18F|nr:hypothetical protein [Chromobacterium sp. IIBBL 290-4]UTH74907.1 hypothetical protein NKT35_02030 [Chromobacterium sp. IIBBL 290-4]
MSKAKSLLAILAIGTFSIAHADHYTVEFQSLKDKIDKEISKRNHLLDKLKINTSPDTILLESFNLNELSIEYLLEITTTFLSKNNPSLNSETSKNIEKFREAATNLCTAQKLQMLEISQKIQDQKIKNEANIQLENTRQACDRFAGFIIHEDRRIEKIY